MACRLESTIWLEYCGGPSMSMLSVFFTKTSHELFFAHSSNNQKFTLISQLTSQDSMEMPGPPQYPNHIVDSNMEALLKTTTELRLELQQTSLELASILLERGKRAQERVHASLLNSALTGDFEQLQMAIEKLTEHIDFVEDVAKLVSNKS